MESKDFISIFSFELKNENGNLVTFIGQSKTFRLSITVVSFFHGKTDNGFSKNQDYFLKNSNKNLNLK